MAVNEMVYNGKVFTKIRKGGAKCNKSESISLSSLPVDTLTVTVVDERHWDFPLANADDQLLYVSEGYPVVTKLSDERLDDYQYGSVVMYYHEGNLVGKFYLEKILQVGKWDWKFSCISDMGMLVSSDHYGGLYNGAKAKDVIADIIGDIIPYTLDSSLQEAELYGWLPKSTRRNNLRDVLFAIGAQVVRDANGNAMFQPYETEPQSYEIVPGKFYKTGGSVNNGTPATQAILTEHAYSTRDTDETEVLFDGEIVGEDIVTPKGAKVNGIIVVFDEPHYDLVVSSATLFESGVNYAVLGSAAYGSLTGKKYTHTQRTLTRDGKVTGIPNVVQSSKCALVNIRNSPSVADRLIAFYGYATKITTDLVLTTQKPGDFVTFTDPYGIRRKGYIQSLEITMSKVMKARATIICGFIPPVDVPMHLHHEFFFANTTWTVPEGVTSVRVVCIGGGPGGPSGVQGGPNTRTGMSHNRGPHKVGSGSTELNNFTREMAPTEGGTGGAGSPGAEGGKVFSTTIVVTPGQQFAIVIGAGGKGGICAGAGAVAGSEGRETKFGNITSNSGSTVPNGYLEEVTGQTYAGKGDDGIAGGDGVTGYGELSHNSFWGDQQLDMLYTIPAGVVYKGVTYTPGQAQNTQTATSSDTGSASSSGGRVRRATNRGLGGGAAAGANGPSTGTTQRNGAVGAVPVKPDAQTKVGFGGHGGHGGGGAGGNGGAGASRDIRTNLSPQSAPTVDSGAQVSGGNGGEGGDGGPGACFIYYYSPEEPTT